MFQPKNLQMTTPIKIQSRDETTINGQLDISYVDKDPVSDFCNWKGYGGTDSTESGSLVVYNTAVVTMWFRPDVNEKDQVLLNQDENLTYEVINVENVEMRNIYLILKVQRVVNA